MYFICTYSVRTKAYVVPAVSACRAIGLLERCVKKKPAKPTYTINSNISQEVRNVLHILKHPMVTQKQRSNQDSLISLVGLSTTGRRADDDGTRDGEEQAHQDGNRINRYHRGQRMSFQEVLAILDAALVLIEEDESNLFPTCQERVASSTDSLRYSSSVSHATTLGSPSSGHRRSYPDNERNSNRRGRRPRFSHNNTLDQPTRRKPPPGGSQ